MGITGDGGKGRREREAKTSGSCGAAAHFFFDLGCGLSIDASRAGNATRYLNHAAPGTAMHNVACKVVRQLVAFLPCTRMRFVSVRWYSLMPLRV